jgi:tetratricopeptide (TPR) repeat protein
MVNDLLELVEETESHLRGPDMKAWLERLNGRYGDIEPAVKQLLAAGRIDDALRFTIALATFWTATGRMKEGEETFDHVLAAHGGEAALRGRALFETGMLAYLRGYDARARERHNECLALGRRLDDPTLTAIALTGLARLELRDPSGFATSLRLCREALALCSESTDNLGLRHALHVGGVAAEMCGELQEARQLMSRRLELGRAEQDFRRVAIESSNLCRVERLLGNPARAEELGREALRISRAVGDMWLTPYILNSLAAIDAERHAFESAVRLLAAADALRQDQGAEWPPDERPVFEATHNSVKAALSVDDFGRGWEDGRRMSLETAVDFALQKVGDE